MGMHNKRFNIYVFWRWYVYAAIAGFIIYWLNSSILSWIINEQFKMIDIWTIGISMYSCIVLVVNLRIMIETNTHNCFSVFLLIFSISSYVGILLFSYFLPSNQTLGQWDYIIHSKVYLLSVILIVAACMLFEYGWRSVKIILEQILTMKTSKTKIPIRKQTDLSSAYVLRGNREYEVKFNHSISNSF